MSFIALVAACLLLSFAPFGPRPAMASSCVPDCSECSSCSIQKLDELLDNIQDWVREEVIPHIISELEDWREWLETVFWPTLAPVFPPMTHQMSLVAMQQVYILAPFFDAKQQLETQRLMDELKVRTRKDYNPSYGVCTLVTNLRSVADSERRAEANTHILSRWGIFRDNASMNVSAAEGAQTELDNRLNQFRQRYCDTSDNNFGFAPFCPGGSAVAQRRNRDLDYAGIMERALTLNIDALDTVLTDDEQDMFALASNLYNHRPPKRMAESPFNEPLNQLIVLDSRAMAAKRSVAEASFFTIAGLKAPGEPDTSDVDPPHTDMDTFRTLRLLLQELNISDQDINYLYLNSLVGVNDVRPSYYAMMEILTKKIFERPGFYVDLYDTPANVDRKDVVLHAIGMMQDFDMLQSNLRTEMMLSLILEMEIVKMQRAVQDNITKLRGSGKSG